MIAPDATATLGFMLERAAGLVDRLVVYPERLRENLGRAKELYFSEAVLLALVHAGMGRQDAYVVVQKSAMRAWSGDGSFRENLAADPAVTSRLSREALDTCFDLEHALAHVPAIVSRALGEEGGQA
jgi:adenylosuccinate lyase